MTSRAAATIACRAFIRRGLHSSPSLSSRTALPKGRNVCCSTSSILPQWRLVNIPFGLQNRQAFLGVLRHYSSAPGGKEKKQGVPSRETIRENIYTIPNVLTLSRIIACPVLGWSILEGNFSLATGLLAYAGITDWVDGFLARKYQMNSVLGTILDPAADKILMTTLTVTLAMKSMLPVPLAVIILGRDVVLGLSAFYIRYKTLPPPRTFARYWDFSLPSAEVHPTAISKINTLLQLVLMGTTTLTPLLSFDIGLLLRGLQWTVAGTTVWSGISYAFFNNAFKVVSKNKSSP